jgi:hypothetical protein
MGMKKLFLNILIILIPSFVFCQQSLRWKVMEYNNHVNYNVNYGNIISANKNKFVIRAKSGGMNDLLLLSNDLGETWESIYSAEERVKIKTIEILDDNSIFLTANEVDNSQRPIKGMIIYSFDLGKTWEFHDFKENERINWLDMYDSSHGIAFTTTKYEDSVNYNLYYTALAWQSIQKVNYPSNYSCSGLWLLDSNVVSIYSNVAEIENSFYKSTDSGKTWVKSDDSVPLGIRNIQADKSGTLWVAGGIPNGIGWQRSDLIAKSENGGLSWEIVMNEEAPPVVFGLDFINMADNGFGVASGGDNKLYFSSDNGKKWFLQDLPDEVWMGPSSPQIAQISGSYIFLQNIFYLIRSDLSFTLKAPKFNSPLSDTSETEDSFVISWNSIDGAHAYELQSSEFLNFSKINHWFRDLKDTIKTVEMNYDTQYYFRVRSYIDKDTSYWSDIRYIVTKESKDKLVSPDFIYPKNFSDNVERNPTIIWNKVKNATYYHMQMAERDIIPGVEIAYEFKFIEDTCIKIDDLKPNQYYFAKIRAFNDDDSSKWNTQTGLGLRFTTGETIGIKTELDIGYNVFSGIYPNPTSISNTFEIEIYLENNSNIKIDLINSFGVEVSEIYSGYKPWGEHTISFQPSGLASGAYWVRIIVNGKEKYEKSLLIIR